MAKSVNYFSFVMKDAERFGFCYYQKACILGRINAGTRRIEGKATIT